MPADRLDALFFRQASAHGVVPLIAARMAAFTDLPADMNEGLALVREAETFRAKQLLLELRELLDCFAAASIPVIPLKGPVLADMLFGDIAARGSQDLDLLIRRADLDRSMSILADLGYQPDGWLTPRLLRVIERYGGEHILFHATRAPVEPHWQAAPNTLAFSLDMHAIWNRSRPATLAGLDVLVLDRADNLIWLSVHGAKEHWGKLKWVADIAAFLNRYPDLDWVKTRSRAASQGCRRCLDVALLLASDLLGSCLPYGVADQCSIRHAAAIADRLRRGDPAPPAPYVLSREYWNGRERLRDRLAYVLRTAFTPRAPHYARLPLPIQLDWVHYLLKAPWDYAATPVRSLMRDLQRRLTSDRN